MRVACFLLVALTAAAQNGSVSGMVTDAVTHMPVKRAMVAINATGHLGGSQATMTDSSGGFTISNLEPGRYRLMFQHQNYPQARFGGVGKNIEIKAGEAAGPVAVELIPGASVSGRVVDEDGDPLPNCSVQMHPAKNPEQGVLMAGSSGSNQDGEWRAFGIAAGKYILSAQCGQQVFQARPFSAGPDPLPSRAYQMQYYPLASEVKGAQAVELTAGNEKSGIDFQMSPATVMQVRGVFSPGGADWHTNIVMLLTPVSERRLNLAGVNMGAILNLEKGTFEFRRVFPGSYLLSVFSRAMDENPVGAVQRVDVGDKPVELTVELKHAIDVSGKVEIESGGNSTNKLTFEQIGVQLLPQGRMGMPGSSAPVSEDGTFTLKGVLPAPWRLQINAPFAFMKAAWLGSTDVTNASLDLSGGAAGTLKIVVSTNTASIRGSAPVGHMVLAELVEEDGPYRGNRGAGVDQNGQYSFGGLAPGTYRLAVTENGGPMPDEGGQEVTVREGETAMVDLKAPSDAKD